MMWLAYGFIAFVSWLLLASVITIGVRTAYGDPGWEDVMLGTVLGLVAALIWPVTLVALAVGVTVRGIVRRAEEATHGERIDGHRGR